MMALGLREWLRKANEPEQPAVPPPPTVDGEVERPVKIDEHFAKLQVEEIRDVCIKALTDEAPDWWDVSNTLLSLAEELLEELEYEFDPEGV